MSSTAALASQSDGLFYNTLADEPQGFQLFEDCYNHIKEVHKVSQHRQRAHVILPTLHSSLHSGPSSCPSFRLGGSYAFTQKREHCVRNQSANYYH